jgi:hypothetical protein
VGAAVSVGWEARPGEGGTERDAINPIHGQFPFAAVGVKTSMSAAVHVPAAALVDATTFCDRFCMSRFALSAFMFKVNECAD